MLCLALLSCLAPDADQPERLVFAHYMVCCPAKGGGATVDDFAAEIQAAQARGIDGFALNCGGWTAKEPHYKARALKLYEAAQQLGTGFRLMISADYCCGLSHDETRDMIETFRDHPNQFRYGGKPVLSTFAGEGADNTHGHQLLEFLDQLGGDAGRACVFVPYFYPRPNITEHPRPEHAQQLLREFPELDGYFYFGAAGSSEQLAASNRHQATAWLGAGKLFMASVTPYYRGLGGNYRCFETGGFEGFAKQWLAAIETGATWVEIVTWNDWGEASYVATFGEPGDTALWDGHWGEMLSHTAYLDAMRYWIDWYKTGHPPTIQTDRLFYAYRPHSAATPGHRRVGDDETARPGGADNLRDEVFVTCYLTAPATLRIESGEKVYEIDLTAGVQHVARPFAPGVQRFVLMRRGQTVLDKTGEHDIQADVAFGNFNMFAGQAP